MASPVRTPDPSSVSPDARIPLSSVHLSERESAYVGDAVATGWISGVGPYVDRFETALAERLGRAFVVATTSGTGALDLILRALEIGPGDEVIVPALTFAAPASAVCAVGASPVFADITEESWTVDPESVRRVRSPRTKLLLAVDTLGHPCDFAALEDLGVPIVEDAAEAHGARYRDRPVGALGVATILSFHANKPISCGEGGCVATDDPALADRIRLLNNHGMRPETPYVHPVVGRNYRMTNLTAALGLAQVERWDELIAGRNAVSAAYDASFSGTRLGRRPVAAWATEGTWLHTVVSESRSAVLDACARAGVDARAIWPPLPGQRAFSEQPASSCPVAASVSAKSMWLPTWSGMSTAQIERVVAAVRDGLAD